MSDLLKKLLQPNSLKTSLFAPNSRYYGIGTAVYETACETEGESKSISYLVRRFVPPEERFAQVREHTVKQGERTDNLSALYHNDPEQFWLLCDANGAMRPEELTETVGKKLRITLPEGIPGGSGG